MVDSSLKQSKTLDWRAGEPRDRDAGCLWYGTAFALGVLAGGFYALRTGNDPVPVSKNRTAAKRKINIRGDDIMKKTLSILLTAVLTAGLLAVPVSAEGALVSA